MWFASVIDAKIGHFFTVVKELKNVRQGIAEFYQRLELLSILFWWN